jgi:hypothetical protein
MSITGIPLLLAARRFWGDGGRAGACAPAARGALRGCDCGVAGEGSFPGGDHTHPQTFRAGGLPAVSDPVSDARQGVVVPLAIVADLPAIQCPEPGFSHQEDGNAFAGAIVGCAFTTLIVVAWLILGFFPLVRQWVEAFLVTVACLVFVVWLAERGDYEY